jgi:hypothetical protein
VSQRDFFACVYCRNGVNKITRLLKIVVCILSLETPPATTLTRIHAFFTFIPHPKTTRLRAFPHNHSTRDPKPETRKRPDSELIRKKIAPPFDPRPETLSDPTGPRAVSLILLPLCIQRKKKKTKRLFKNKAISHSFLFYVDVRENKHYLCW